MSQKNIELYQVFMCQNVLILPYYIHEKYYSVKIGSISFFSSSDMQKFHHLLGCHTIGINATLIIFFKCFAFFKFSLLDKKAVLIRLKIKTIRLTKKLFLIVIKVTVFYN